MNHVIACVDGAAYTPAVCDCAAWAAQRLAAPLTFLQVLDRHPERAPLSDSPDWSGNIGLGTQETLLQELGALDAQRSKLAQRQGRELLDSVMRRASALGVATVESRQRHGSLVETLLALEPESRLFVLGQHPHAGQAGRLHLDHTVEQVIRAVQRPVLVASGGCPAPTHAAIAFDGSPASHQIVEAVACSPLLTGLRCDVVMAGEDSASHREPLEWARARLAVAGFQTQAAIVAGEPETSLPAYLAEHAIDLLVMGAYGHSRIRQLIVGSTTTTLLRTSPVPVLVLR